MSKSRAYRWRNLRVTERGGTVNELARRKCPECRRWFRPAKPQHKRCYSCAVKFRQPA